MLDLKKFKKLSQDDKYVHLMHEKGHQVKLAHSALKGDLKNLISELPHYADGGEVEKQPQSLNDILDPFQDFSKPELEKPAYQDPNELRNAATRAGMTVPEYQAAQGITPPAYQDPNELRNAATRAGMTVPEYQAAYGITPQFEAPKTEGAPTNFDLSQVAQPQQQAVLPPVDASAGIQQGLQTAQQGIMGEASAMQQKAQAEQKIYQEQQKQAMAMQQHYEQSFNELDNERKMLMQDIKQNRIEPNRYVNNMSGGEKVGTAIGLLLSGFGAGLSGDKNMAMDYLNTQIERDIAAQKMNLGKQENLLAALNHQYGNLNNATNVARMFYSDLYSSKIAEAAAKTNDPMAKARAQQAIGELQLKYAPLMAQTARTQAVFQGNRQGLISAEQSIPVLFQDEGMKKQAFDELKQVRSAQKQVDMITDSMKKVAQLQSIDSRAASPIQSKSQINALNTEILSKAKEIFGGLSDAELHLMDNNLIHYSDNKNTINKKIDTIQNMLSSKISSPVLDSVGLNYGKIVSAKSKVKPNVNVAPRGK